MGHRLDGRGGQRSDRDAARSPRGIAGQPEPLDVMDCRIRVLAGWPAGLGRVHDRQPEQRADVSECGRLLLVGVRDPDDPEPGADAEPVSGAVDRRRRRGPAVDRRRGVTHVRAAVARRQHVDAAGGAATLSSRLPRSVRVGRRAGAPGADRWRAHQRAVRRGAGGARRGDARGGRVHPLEPAVARPEVRLGPQRARSDLGARAGYDRLRRGAGRPSARAGDQHRGAGAPGRDPARRAVPRAPGDAAPRAARARPRRRRVHSVRRTRVLRCVLGRARRAARAAPAPDAEPRAHGAGGPRRSRGRAGAAQRAAPGGLPP